MEVSEQIPILFMTHLCNALQQVGSLHRLQNTIFWQAVVLVKLLPLCPSLLVLFSKLSKGLLSAAALKKITLIPPMTLVATRCRNFSNKRMVYPDGLKAQGAIGHGSTQTPVRVNKSLDREWDFSRKYLRVENESESFEGKIDSTLRIRFPNFRDGYGSLKSCAAALKSNSHSANDSHCN